jgi:branched-chain amino acid aminotransferase
MNEYSFEEWLDFLHESELVYIPRKGRAMASIWINGRVTDSLQPVIAAQDRGFLLGDGLFETIRVVDGLPRRLDAHIARAAAGARVLGLAMPENSAAAVEAVIAANGLGNGSVRFTLTRGSGGRGLDLPPDPSPTFLVSATAHAPLVGPVRLSLGARFRRDEISPLAGVKALGYLPHVLARRQAVEQGADDALMPNTSGRLACSSVANVLVWRNARWETPPLTDGALAGTARAQLVQAGLAHEAPVPLEVLSELQAAVLVNALGARAAVMLNNRALSWPFGARAQLSHISHILQLPCLETV